MKNKNIFLIGGGEIAKNETQEIDKTMMKLAPWGSTLVFFGTAKADDSEEYAEVIQKVFRDYFNIVIASKAKGKEFSENAIKSASVVYLGGGTTKLLMDHFEDWNLVHLLQEAIDRDVVVAGMSAGAQALATWYIHEENDSQEIREGWGLVGGSIGVLVHATNDSFSRAKSLCKKKKDSKLYGIGEGAALRFNKDNTEGIKVGNGSIWTV